VVRPARAPCGERAALSWDHGALRGHDPTCRDGHRFRRPARRFDALRATARSGVPDGLLRPTPSVRLPIPFRGPSQHPRTVPDPRRDPCQTMLPPLGFAAPRHMPERRVVSAGRPTPQRAARGLDTPSRPPRRPSGNLAAPERPRASPFKAFSSRRSDALSGAPALLPFPASVRLAPQERGGRGRLQGLDPGSELVLTVAPLRARRADAFLGFVPPERSPPPSWRALCVAPAPSPRVGRG